MRRAALERADESGTPMVPRMHAPVAGLATVAVGLPMAWVGHAVGASWTAAGAALALYGVAGAMAQEGPQRRLGGGRLDNRPVPRAVIGMALFGSLHVLLALPFLTPLPGVLVATVHVHWSGSRATRPLILVVLGATAAAMAPAVLGLAPCALAPGPACAVAGLTAVMAAQTVGTLGMVVGRREQLAREVTRARELFAALVQQSVDVAAVVDRGGLLRYVSPAAGTALGVPAGHLVGRPATDLVSASHRAEAGRQLRAVADGSRGAGSRWEAPTGVEAAGSRWLELTARNLLDDGVVDGLLLHVRDVTERRRFHDRLEYAAAHDALTGLLGRGEFFERAARMVARARPGQGIAALYCDLDAFKDVNDTHGHAAGDEVLATTAQRLRTALRPGDLLGRIGGDEFAAILPDVADAQAVDLVVERLAAATAAPIRLALGRTLVQLVSIGSALTDDPDTSPDDLLQRADHAMYLHKRRAGV